METNTKDLSSRDEEMEKADINLQMGQFTWGNGSMGKYKDRELASGLTRKSTKVVGLTIKKMVRGNTVGLMGDAMKANTKMI